MLDTLSALGLSGEWERFGKGRCEHVSTLVVLLGEALAAAAGTDVNETRTGIGRAGQKFILVLDGIEKQREAPQTLLVALARLGEVVSIVVAVVVSGHGLLAYVQKLMPVFCADSLAVRRSDPGFQSSAAVSPVCRSAAYRFPAVHAQRSDQHHSKREPAAREWCVCRSGHEAVSEFRRNSVRFSCRSDGWYDSCIPFDMSETLVAIRGSNRQR